MSEKVDFVSSKNYTNPCETFRRNPGIQYGYFTKEIV